MRAWFASEIAAVEFDEGKRAQSRDAEPSSALSGRPGDRGARGGVALSQAFNFDGQDVQGLRPADEVLG